jgi:hypothetical protein
MMVDALPPPHLPAGVPRIGQDRRHRPQRPRRIVPVRIPARIMRRRRGDTERIERAGDTGRALPGKPLREAAVGRGPRRRGRTTLPVSQDVNGEAEGVETVVVMPVTPRCEGRE